MFVTDTQLTFSHLSLKDLIEARDLFHAHLIHKKNVVATAVGRYLIRLSDLDENGNYRRAKSRGPRTLENSIVTRFSWPCILVFINQWEPEADLVAGDATELIPKSIYMPDGRVVPICIVEAKKMALNEDTIPVQRLNFPTNYVGGGFPLSIVSQKKKYYATIGCIVSDGHKYYALTNRHVAGEEGETVNTVMGKSEVLVGVTSKHSLGKVRFSQLYPEWTTHADVNVTCDVGLVTIDDINIWKTDVLGIGVMDEIFDLSTRNLDLRLVAEYTVKNGRAQVVAGESLVAHGAISGKMEGEIKALFYRHKSVGGTEFLSDFLICGKGGAPLNVHHGDSGAVWHVLSEEGGTKKHHPIALHWGQHEFVTGEGRDKFSYALATCLSNVCRELSVDIVRGWNIDREYSWGKLGHYKIAARACEIVKNKKLRKLLLANIRNIAFTDDALSTGLEGYKKGTFAALADVPDLVWRTSRKKDEANHFADMDERIDGVFDGKSLMDLCKSDKNIDIDVWNKYYEATEVADERKDRNKRGALPFRVWQAYNLMVVALREKKLDEFIFIGGTVSHYLGDACQPLHISYLHHGRNADESDVHSVYETDMVDRYAEELINGVNALTDVREYDKYTGGKEAAKATIALMRKVYRTLPPETILDCFSETGSRGRIANMWEQLKGKTFTVMAEGCFNLARFWESAWAEGEGDKIFKEKELKEISQKSLMTLYNDPTKFPSFRLIDPKFKEALEG